MEIFGADIGTIVFSALFLVDMCILIGKSIKQHGVDSLAALATMAVCILFVVVSHMSSVVFDLKALLGLAIMALSIFYCVSFLRSKKKDSKK
ncbi:MAG: hypothetical protein E7430_02250 [Ruminococcaceae bacterium]|nr:hypothetical protein [Oscillospiraceae bacterium]